MNREALAQKVLILGVDGMDPRFSRKMLREGRMPNLQKLIDRGSCREDLVLVGGVPTITPPMWTSLSTGANPGTHGITCFWAQSKRKLDEITYNLDSRTCRAEQLWDVTAKAGKKTLVWHWPGCSWPPTMESPNLHVVEGTNPSTINTGIAEVDNYIEIHGYKDLAQTVFKPKDAPAESTGAGCVISGLEVGDDGGIDFAVALKEGGLTNIELTHPDGEGSVELMVNDRLDVALLPASGWEMELPEGTLEMTLFFNHGFARRFALLVPDQNGKYQTVAFYKSKKDTEAMGVATREKCAYNMVDEYTKDGNKVVCVRSAYIVELAEDSSVLKIGLTNAIDVSRDDLFAPKELYHQIIEGIGYLPGGFSSADIPFQAVAGIGSWTDYADWCANAMNMIIKENGYEVVFSHFHNVDCMGHSMWPLAKTRERYAEGVTEADYHNVMVLTYEQTDYYISKFMYLLDEGWTILLVSDHGLIVGEAEEAALMGDPFGVNARVMYELGYHALKTDENGKIKRETDWTKTLAVAPRGNHIFINLKGRTEYGIVDPTDQYALEERIINDLYNYRDEHGERIIMMAVRNKDAEVFGMGGENCGDIVYFVNERTGRVHGDTWSAAYGYNETSVSPIFVAAGPGIKEGFKTTRAIHTIDVAPTVAVLLGVRMPAQCEGAPAYQIFTEEF